jgi:hypothetical protein
MALNGMWDCLERSQLNERNSTITSMTKSPSYPSLHLLALFFTNNRYLGPSSSSCSSARHAMPHPSSLPQIHFGHCDPHRTPTSRHISPMFILSLIPSTNSPFSSFQPLSPAPFVCGNRRDFVELGWSYKPNCLLPERDRRQPTASTATHHKHRIDMRRKFP